MDRKLISVFFSALICSTLGHEYLKAHELSHSARLNSRSRPDEKNTIEQFKSRSPKPERDNQPAPGVKKRTNQQHSNRVLVRDSSEVCSYTCPVPAPSDAGNWNYLRLLRITEINAFAILNSTDQVAVVFDLSSVLILNGITGVMIWLDLKTETGIHFRSEANVGWVRGEGRLLPFLLKLGPLSSVKDLNGGNKFNIKTVPNHISVEVSIILKSLAPSLTEKLNKNAKASISILVLLTKLLGEHPQTISLILDKMETNKIIVSGELTIIASTLIGLGLLNARLQGNFKVLITREFSSSLLLSARSGIEILIYLIKQAGDSVDVAKVFGNILASPEALLEVLVELDGGFYRGVPGLTAVIHNIHLYVAKKITLEAVVDILIQVGAENTEKITKDRWLTIITDFIGVIKVQTEKYGSQQSLSAVSNFLNDIKEDKLIIGGINVSAVINILIESSGQTGQTNLVAIVKVLLLLQVVVSVTLILAILVLRLIWFVISGEGIIFILKLLPKIKIEIDFSSTTNIIKQILSKVQVWKLTKYIVTLDVVGIISQLPVIGDIFQSVEVALKESGNQKINLRSTLKESGVVIGAIKDWVWWGLGVSGGKQPSGGGIAGASFVGGGVETSWTARYTSTVTWTQSGGSLVSGSGSSGSGSQAQESGSSGGSGSASGSGGSSGSGSGGGSSGGSGSGSFGGSSGGSGSGGGGGSSGSSGSASGGGSKGSSGSSGWSWSWGGNSGSSSSGSSKGSGSAGGSGGSSGSGSFGASGSAGAGGSSGGEGSSGGKGGRKWGWGWGR